MEKQEFICFFKKQTSCFFCYIQAKKENDGIIHNVVDKLFRMEGKWMYESKRNVGSRNLCCGLWSYSYVDHVFVCIWNGCDCGGILSFFSHSSHRFAYYKNAGYFFAFAMETSSFYFCVCRFLFGKHHAAFKSGI